MGAESCDGAHGHANAALAADVIERLGARGLTVATCESLTAGMVAATLAQVPGASNALRGGLVTYATDLKERLAGVDPGLLAAQGAVDPDVALQMAQGAAAVCGAHIGLACTGVAGPDPQDGSPVGRVYVALATPHPKAFSSKGDAVDGRPEAPGRVERLMLAGDRQEIRAATVRECLRLVLLAV